MKNKCPHPTCEVMKPREMYACKPHWFSLPKRIRDKIWTGYRSNIQLWLEADKEAQEYWKGQVHG